MDIQEALDIVLQLAGEAALTEDHVADNPDVADMAANQHQAIGIWEDWEPNPISEQSSVEGLVPLEGVLKHIEGAKGRACSEQSYAFTSLKERILADVARLALQAAWNLSPDLEVEWGGTTNVSLTIKPTSFKEVAPVLRWLAAQGWSRAKYHEKPVTSGDTMYWYLERGKENLYLYADFSGNGGEPGACQVVTTTKMVEVPVHILMCPDGTTADDMEGDAVDGVDDTDPDDVPLTGDNAPDEDWREDR